MTIGPDALLSSTPSGLNAGVDEKGALAALVEAHADFVWRSLRRLGVPEAVVDDETQRVFMIAQSKLPHIAPGRERAFLFGVAMNVAAHARRTVARRREVNEEQLVGLVDPRPLPDAELDERRARALLDEVLDTMSIELRTVFVLFELEELSMAEIADVLEIPPGTVASRLRRAREEFQKVAQRVRSRVERLSLAPNVGANADVRPSADPQPATRAEVRR